MRDCLDAYFNRFSPTISVHTRWLTPHSHSPVGSARTHAARASPSWSNWTISLAAHTDTLFDEAGHTWERDETSVESQLDAAARPVKIFNLLQARNLCVQSPMMALVLQEYTLGFCHHFLLPHTLDTGIIMSYLSASFFNYKLDVSIAKNQTLG